jgi:carbon-monoxide dehydrogenase large subunit
VAAEPVLLHLETPSPANPEGFKGAGESGTVPVPGAIANAVEDALRQLKPDAVVRELPLTPMRVLEILT